MKKYIHLSLILLLAACSSKNTAQKNTPEQNTTASTSGNVSTQTEGKVEKEKEKDVIKWLSYDEAVKQSKKKPKKIFIDVYTDWCGWCKKMDKTTFEDAKIATYVNKKYYAVKLNAESSKIITFQGKQMTERELSTKVFKITGYPCTVYLDTDEKLIQPIPGYMDVPTLDKILHYIGDDHYKTETWEQFQLSYTGE